MSLTNLILNFPNYFYILVDGPRTSGDPAEHLRSTSWTTQEPIGNGFVFLHVF